MSHHRILIVLTSHKQMGDSGKPTGFHYEEMTTPYFAFKEAGYEVVLASIAGGEPPHDPNSLKDPLEDNAPSVIRFLQDELATNALKHSRALNELAQIDIDEFDAIYLPGGHGTMWDFPDNDYLAPVVSALYQRNKPVAAVCHGIAGLIGAQKANGEPLVKGLRVNCFTNAEETAVGLEGTVPFLLETALRDLGAEFECSENFQSHLAVDGNLITGQNPASAEGVAHAVLSYLRKT